VNKLARIKNFFQSTKGEQALSGYILISPMILGFLIFVLAPTVSCIFMGLTNWPLIKAPKFIGLSNYIKIFTSDLTFKRSVWNTIYFTLLLVPANIIITLGLALLLWENVKGVGIFRTIIFTPYVTSMVVWTIVWRFIFQTDNGAINLLLKQLFGVTGPHWLFNERLGIPIVATVTLLKGLGLNMIVFINALQEIPRMYYEAALIDGANGFKMFRYITLPLLTPTIFLLIIITTIASLKVFTQIKIMTDGGPGTSTYVMVFYIYQKAFRFNEFGYACAVATILFITIFILTLLQWKMKGMWVYGENEEN